MQAGFLDAVLASKPDQSSVLFIEVEPYGKINLPGSTEFPKWPENVKALMENKLALYKLLLSAMSDAYFAIGLEAGPLGLLYDETTATLTGKIAAAEKVQEDFRKAVVYCRSLITAGNGANAEDNCRNRINPTLTAQMAIDAKPKRKS